MVRVKKKSDPRATSAKKIEKLRHSFRFLLGHEQAASVFTVTELVVATGWKRGTISTYLGKKWKPFVHRATGGYPVCQRWMRQPVLDISVPIPMGGEWSFERAQETPSI